MATQALVVLLEAKDAEEVMQVIADICKVRGCALVQEVQMLDIVGDTQEMIVRVKVPRPAVN